MGKDYYITLIMSLPVRKYEITLVGGGYYDLSALYVPNDKYENGLRSAFDREVGHWLHVRLVRLTLKELRWLYHRINIIHTNSEMIKFMRKREKI